MQVKIHKSDNFKNVGQGMKKIVILILILAAMTLLLPFSIVSLSEKIELEKNEKKTEETHEKETVSDTVAVFIKDEDIVREMEISQYLKEVVSAEMPAEFHIEALKAQAVAARTYLINRKNAFADSEKPECHKGADICTDSTHCKAWISEARRRELWGDMAEENWQKISRAVDETTGVIITYNEEPISAVFHSTSSGMTENSEDVWGGDVPYLKSIKSEGDKVSPKYSSMNSFTVDQFKNLVEAKVSGTDWQKGIYSDILRSDAGGIISIKLGGVKVKGTEFRNIFSLRSTNVELIESGEKIDMSVKGYGHGVGMSQYGANYLANQGMGYEEILKTYYSGVSVGEYKF